MWPFRKHKEIEVPPKEWYSQGVPSFTPDAPFLETRPFWRVLVVDEMMAPHFMNRQLGEDAVKRVDAFTMDRFSMWKKEEGAASQVIPLETKFMSVPFTHIRGQLWRVPTSRLYVLDSMKQNGVEFSRKRVQLAIPFHYTEWNKVEFQEDGSVTKGEPNVRRLMDTSLKAWMYVGRDDFWKPKLLRGSKITVDRVTQTIHGRLLDGKSYYPVKTFAPKSPLLSESYYYYARTEYFNSE